MPKTPKPSKALLRLVQSLDGLVLSMSALQRDFESELLKRGKYPTANDDEKRDRWIAEERQEIYNVDTNQEAA